LHRKVRGGEKPLKLPQARFYLNSARWGVDQLIDGKFIGEPFRFHIIGILASLRAVQHALRNHDAKISPAHKRVINEWWNDQRVKESADLAFIKTARDLVLKGGLFEAYAILHAQRCRMPLRGASGNSRISKQSCPSYSWLGTREASALATFQDVSG
jgi:hypothetical protein